MVAPLRTPLISSQQIAQFRADGFCVVDALFSEAEIAEIEGFFEDFKIHGGRIYDGGASYSEIDPTKAQLRAMHPHRYSKKAEGWMLQPNVLEVLEALLDRPPLAAQTMYYFKPPGAKGQGMHQDNFYLHSAPATCIAAWTAIDTADLENGCLYVVPKSQRKDIYCPTLGEGKEWMNYGDSHIKPFPRDARPIPVIVPRGSTMFFSGNLIHGSGPNRTRDRSRRTFIGHYVDHATERLSKFYHPVLDGRGSVVSRIEATERGGPCGDGFFGAVH
ncbi:MAG: phytanoyl-CoA dioxygenase family protein [Terrimicrobiaceae bacterium]|nr:phytanoyl-CoA dioxygenase family protein [Terrimicrobiaceae bacterium]